MNAENINIQMTDGQTRAEVIIREVSNVNELPIKAPLLVDIKGTIGAPYEFLLKRKDSNDQIDEKRCHILVNREEISIILVTNENDPYLKDTIRGTLQIHPKFKEFGINAAKVWTPTELGMFFKMNRSFFTTKEDNMKLVTELMNFTATVNNKIERSAKESGDRTDNFSQAVNSNLPKSFNLQIPIFKGTQAEDVEVETFAQINGRDVSFILLSPGAQSALEDIRDKAIDTQLDAIKGICPDIAIIEQ